MKTRVNLYQDVLKPRIDPMPLQRVLSIWCAVLFICICLVYVGKDLEQQAKKRFQNASAAVQTGQSEVDKLKLELARRQDLSKLNQVILELKQQVEDKNKILRYVENESSKNSTDYAAVFRDLARYHKPGIWLTRIYLKGGELVLEGEMSKPEELSGWLQGLKRSAYFAGKSFSVLEFAEDKAVRRFRIATTRAKVPAGQLKKSGGQL